MFRSVVRFVQGKKGDEAASVAHMCVNGESEAASGVGGLWQENGGWGLRPVRFPTEGTRRICGFTTVRSLHGNNDPTESTPCQGIVAELSEQSDIDQSDIDALAAIASRQLAYGNREVRADDLSHIVLSDAFPRLESRGLISSRRYPGYFDHGVHHDPGWILCSVTPEGLRTLWGRRS